MKMKQLLDYMQAEVNDPNSTVTWDSEILFIHAELDFSLFATATGVATARKDGSQSFSLSLDYPSVVFKEEIAAAKEVLAGTETQTNY